MDGAMIAMLIKDIALPEIMAVVRAHHNAGLPPPTNEQVLAAVELNAGRFIAVGEAFLAGLPKPPAFLSGMTITNQPPQNS